MAYRQTDKTRNRMQNTRQRILAAARALVAEGGFAAVHISDVAHAANVASGTIYRYFPSKANLLTEVFRHVTQHEFNVMQAVAKGGTPAPDRLAGAIETFAHRAVQAPVLAYALIFEPVDPAVDTERLAYRRAYARILGNLLQECIASNQAPAQNIPVVANGIVGALAEALIGPLARSPDAIPAERHADITAITRFCLNAVSCHQRIDHAPS